jgi:hypothetical protein
MINSGEFKEIVVFKDFEVGNGELGLERDIYLSFVICLKLNFSFDKHTQSHILTCLK